MKSSMTYRFSFEFRGIKHDVELIPQEGDYWTSVESNGAMFDIHYDEQYMDISVYHVTEDSNGQLQIDVTNTVASIPIEKAIFLTPDNLIV